jgi:hypothetical protein
VKGRSAVQAFVRYAKVNLASLDPSADLLTMLKAYGGRACPLTCGVRYEPKGDSCVLKTCPKGMSLGGTGSCYAPPPPKQAAPAASGGRKAVAGGGSGGGCVRETEQQCIGRLSNATDQGRHKGGNDTFGVEVECSSPANRICR